MLKLHLEFKKYVTDFISQITALPDKIGYIFFEF